MIKEGPSLEEKIGVALPVSDVFLPISADISAECPAVKTPELPWNSFQLNQGSAGDFSCLALQGEFKECLDPWVWGAPYQPYQPYHELETSDTLAINHHKSLYLVGKTWKNLEKTTT